MPIYMKLKDHDHCWTRLEPVIIWQEPAKNHMVSNRQFDWFLGSTFCHLYSEPFPGDDTNLVTLNMFLDYDYDITILYLYYAFKLWLIVKLWNNF